MEAAGPVRQVVCWSRQRLECVRFHRRFGFGAPAAVVRGQACRGGRKAVLQAHALSRKRGTGAASDPPLRNDGLRLSRTPVQNQEQDLEPPRKDVFPRNPLVFAWFAWFAVPTALLRIKGSGPPPRWETV